jgi:hypothetical protein
VSGRIDRLRKALLGKDEIIITRHGKEVARLSPTQPQDSATKEGQAERSCSFCGKAQAEVAKLIAGPTVFICNECVGLCVQILREDGIAPETQE